MVEQMMMRFSVDGGKGVCKKGGDDVCGMNDDGSTKVDTKLRSKN